MNDTAPCPQHFEGFAAGRWRTFDFAPFREGVDICILRQDPPTVALLRYGPGAAIARHVHTGLETILVLEGTQSDERGDYPEGSLVLNPEGSAHSVWSAQGCVVLIQWERPVRFLEEER